MPDKPSIFAKQSLNLHKNHVCAEVSYIIGCQESDGRTSTKQALTSSLKTAVLHLENSNSLQMARKIRRVSGEAVGEVHGARRVHRAGSRSCIFCDSHHASGTTEIPNTANVNIDVMSSVINIYNSNNVIMRNDTTVTMTTISVPQYTEVNLSVEEDSLPSTMYRIHAVTLSPTGLNNTDGTPRSFDFSNGNQQRLHTVLMTIRCSANTTLP